MTALVSVGMIILLFLIPFLVGNIYSAVLRKKDMGIARLYLSGLVIMYAGLFIMQLAVVKFRFDFAKMELCYHIYFVALIVLGLVALCVNVVLRRKVKFDLIWSKKAILIYGLIVLQGFLSFLGQKN